jgi:uncharacterized Tic20 family protein
MSESDDNKPGNETTRPTAEHGVPEPAAPTQTPPEPSTPETNPEARQWGMIAHLSALAGFLIPFGNLVGPLVVWQMKKEIPFVDDQGKESLNFQITVTIAVIVSIILMAVLIGLLLLPVIGIAAFILTIVAGLKANGGEPYRYPFTLRLIH